MKRNAGMKVGEASDVQSAADIYTQGIDDLIGQAGRSFGFKRKRGEPVIPWGLFLEAVREAYRAGAKFQLATVQESE